PELVRRDPDSELALRGLGDSISQRLWLERRAVSSHKQCALVPGRDWRSVAIEVVVECCLDPVGNRVFEWLAVLDLLVAKLQEHSTVSSRGPDDLLVKAKVRQIRVPHRRGEQ